MGRNYSKLSKIHFSYDPVCGRGGETNSYKFNNNWVRVFKTKFRGFFIHQGRLFSNTSFINRLTKIKDLDR